jgi:hypothetical protein
MLIKIHNLNSTDYENKNFRQKITPHNGLNLHSKRSKKIGHWWLTPIILATQEAEIRRITV